MKIGKTIIGLFIFIALFGTGYFIGTSHELSVLPAEEIADNVENLLYENGYPLSHFPPEQIDQMTIGEFKFKYKNYYMSSRGMLESLMIDICYRNLTKEWILGNITIGNITEPKKKVIMKVIQ